MPMAAGKTSSHLLPFIDPKEYNWRHHLALWSEMAGLYVDSIPFSFEGHRYLFPLFMDTHPRMVWMKSAQMGATIWMLLRAFHQCLYPEAWGFETGIKVGFFFPEGPGLNLLVKGRVEPMMRTCSELEPYSREMSRSWKPVKDSALYFLYMGGTSSKDSTPLMSMFFDEVRLMDVTAVEQAKERVSHSPIKYIHMVSTAGYPDDDIHMHFMDSDQKWFTTVCERCNYEQILCLDFPDCIAEHRPGTPRAGQSYYICKKCRREITDPQRGLYVPHGDPKHEISGYQVSQLLSTRQSPAEIMTVFRRIKNKKEFFNAKLGIPYIDEENRPLSIEMLDNNVDPLIEWGPSFGVSNFMGVDQMSGYNYIMIVSRQTIGELRRLLWFEIINDRSPFKRTAELMELFDIQVCVCDAEPNTNDSLKFAKRFGRKVYLAKTGENDEMFRWKDSWRPKKEHRRADPSTYHQYRLFLDHYQSVERTIDYIKDRQLVWPDPADLTQKAFPYQGGREDTLPIMLTHAYPMFCSPVKERYVKKEEEKIYGWRWHFLGCDPHALMALNYALRASERKVTGNPFVG